MKFIFLMFCLLSCMFSAKSQDYDIVSEKQQKCVRLLRKLRDEINGDKSDSITDSLLRSINSILNVTKTLSDTTQLNTLSDYFHDITDNLSKIYGKMRDTGIYYLSKDLNLKLSAYQKNKFNLETAVSLFQYYEVRVHVYIKGIDQNIGNHIVYWSKFKGGEQERLIKDNIYNGNSNQFVNPVPLKIILPGYITFWLQDAANLKFYKSVPDHFLINADDKEIEVNFIAVDNR